VNTSTRTRTVFKVGRFCVSAILIYWLLCRVDIEELAGALATSKWWLFSFSTFVLCARQLVAAYRWAIILAASRIRIPTIRLFYWYMIATFFNMFLPTALGGDVVRIYQLGKSSGENAVAAASVLMERILGFLALIGMAVVAMFLSATGQREFTICAAVSVAVLVYAMALVALFHRRVGRMLAASLRRAGLRRISQAVERGFAALYALQEHRRNLVLAFIISVLFQGVGVVCTFLVGLSLGLDVS